MPALGHARRNVTAVIQHQGPTQATRQVSRDIVTMREELFTGPVTKDPAKLADALQRQARELQEATVSARSLPVLGGAYYVQASFTNVGSTLTIIHGLQQQVSWIACRSRTQFKKWAASAAYTSGNYVVPSPRTGCFYIANTTGTSSGSQPAFPLGAGQSVVDNTVTWICMGQISTALDEVSQDAANGRIVLGSPCPQIVDIWFFPQPSPTGT